MGRPKGSKNKVKPETIVNEQEEILQDNDNSITQLKEELDMYKLENQNLKNQLAELDIKYKRIFKKLQSKENNLE